MIEFDCGDCGTTLVVVASTLRNAPIVDGEELARPGPYPSLFLTCPDCGAAWEQTADGELVKRRKRVAPNGD